MQGMLMRSSTETWKLRRSLAALKKLLNTGQLDARITQAQQRTIATTVGLKPTTTRLRALRSAD